MRKSLLFGLIVVVLAGVGWAGWMWWTKKQAAEAATQETVATAEVQRQAISQLVEVSGDLEPVEQVDIKSQVSARLEKLHATLGQHVKKGDLLAELDDSDLQIELDTTRIEISGAQLTLKKAKDDHERNERLLQRQLIPAAETLDSLNIMRLAENTLEKAKKREQVVQDKLSKTQITAPMDGFILELPVVEGQVVVAAASVNSGTLLMKLADLSRLLIQTHVNQVDVARMHTDQAVTFTVDPLPGETFEGRVFTIAPTATIKNNIKGFAVEILIDKPDARLRPGMTVDVTAQVETVDNALCVPLTAVFTEPDRSRVAYVVSGEKKEPVKRPVTVGISNLDFVQILTGLEEGDVVLLTRPPRNT